VYKFAVGNKAHTGANTPSAPPGPKNPGDRLHFANLSNFFFKKVASSCHQLPVVARCCPSKSRQEALASNLLKTRCIIDQGRKKAARKGMRTMRKLRSDRYEAQIGKDFCNKLYEMLLEPNADLKNIQTQCPPWKTGPNKGQPPTLRTLLNITARARAEKLLEQMQDAGEILVTARLQAPQVLNVSPNILTNQICNLLAQEILEKTVKGEDPRIRASLFRLLLSHQKIQVERMRWERLNVQDIYTWYTQLGPHKQDYDRVFSKEYPDAVRSLGMRIYGEEWGEIPKPIRLNNGKVVYPEGTGPQDWAEYQPKFPPEPGHASRQPRPKQKPEEHPAKEPANPPPVPPPTQELTSPPSTLETPATPEPTAVPEPPTMEPPLPSAQDIQVSPPVQPQTAVPVNSDSCTLTPPVPEYEWLPRPGSKCYIDYYPMTWPEIAETFRKMKKHKETSKMQAKAAGRLIRRG
jgi:hypothetical protein